MNRNWKIFLGGPNGTQRRGLPRVTLSKAKVFLLNRAAFECLGRPAAVELRFDRRTGTIGLAPTDAAAANAFPLKAKGDPLSRKYDYHTINAAAFCTAFHIWLKHTILFAEPTLDEEGTLLLEMSTAVVVSRGSR